MLSPPPAFLVRSRCTDDGCPESVRRLCLAVVEPADALPGRARTWAGCYVLLWAGERCRGEL